MCAIAIGKITIEQDPILGTNWQRNNNIIIMPTHCTPSQAIWESVIVMDEVVCRKIRKTPITNKQAVGLGVGACGCHHMLYWMYWGGFGVTQDFFGQGSHESITNMLPKRGAGFPWHFLLISVGFTIFGCGVEQDYQRPGKTLL
jgi:hypothetical protein